MGREAMRELTAPALLLACGLAGCASNGNQPPDTAGDIGQAAGRVATMILDQVPVVNTVIDAVDETRSRMALIAVERRTARAAARIDDRRWEQCRENPCLYAARCAALFPDEFIVPDCNYQTQDAQASTASGDTAESTAATTATASLRDTLKAVEGLTLVPSHGHVCYGHHILWDEEFGPMTLGDCEVLLERDIQRARIEALRVFGAADDARTELCYWSACRRFATSDDLAAAVATDAKLLAADPTRAARIAATVR